MRLLARSFALLEALADQPGSRLDELAASTGLPRATCARLLAALDQLGWVFHHGDRGGWQLGPRAQAFAESAPFQTRLLVTARPHLAAAAGELRQPVVLSVLRGTRRLVLDRVWPHGAHDRHLVEDELIATASGRLLLAMQPAATRRRLCAQLGLPDQRRWPGCVDRREILAELAQLARRRTMESQTRQQTALMIALPDGKGDWAVLHTYGPLPGQARVRTVLLQTAARIAEELGASAAAARPRPAPGPGGSAQMSH